MQAVSQVIARLIMRRPAVIRSGEIHNNPWWRIKNLETGAYLKIGRIRGDKPLKITLDNVPAGRYLIRSGGYSQEVNFAAA